MKLINSTVEILEQGLGFEGILKHIELCGRVAYKSEDKINDFSAEKFVDMIRKRKHTAVLEHGTIYLAVLDSLPGGFGGPASEEEASMLEFYYKNPYSKVVEKYIGMGAYQYYITTNYRVLIKNDRLKDLEYQCALTDYHPRRITAKFTCDRGVSHEFVRHRVFSFVQESTRYCNYSRAKFGNECTFIKPLWFNKYMNEDYSKITTVEWQYGLDVACAETTWLYAMLFAENAYFSSIDSGMTPQQARAVLPNSLKTELVMTGFVDEWKHFFNLRTNKDAHPQAKELADKLLDIFCDQEILCPCDIDHNIS